MKTIYGIIAGVLFTLIAVGAYIGLCKSATRTARVTRLKNLFGTVVGGVRRYTVDLFKGNGPVAVPSVDDDSIPMGA